MKFVVALATLALVALAAPSSHAQAPTGLTLVARDAGLIPYEGNGSFGFDLTVGCLEFVQNPTATGIQVTITDPQAWLEFTPTTVTADFTDCGPSGTYTTTGVIPFTVTKAAQAVSQTTVHLQATIGETESNAPAVTYTVEYVSNYTVQPAVSFPFTVTEPVTTFKVTGTQASNAPSMIMVDEFSANNGATISGFGALQYANTGATPESKEYTIKFTAPEGKWETATATLKTYGHYNFDGIAGDPEDRKTFTWQFVNGGVEPKDNATGGGSEESPAPVAVVTAVGLLAFAAMRRRDD